MKVTRPDPDNNVQCPAMPNETWRGAQYEYLLLEFRDTIQPMHAESRSYPPTELQEALNPHGLNGWEASGVVQRADGFTVIMRRVILERR